MRHRLDSQSFVVRVIQDNGIHMDVTNEAKLTLEDGTKAKLDKNLLTPKATGKTHLKVEWKGISKSIPITVENPELEPPVSFRLDVMPVFMKAECNRCHGSARGQDGFKLSLWGFDPETDYFRITREFPGRRVNLAVPEESMLITKADGEAAHTGGKKFEKGSPLYHTMLRWLKAGALDDPKDVAQVKGVELMPGSLVLQGPGQNFRMNVRATFTDGSTRDVTTTALFLSNNEGTAKVGADGTLTTGTRGEAFVMARYGAFTVGAQVIVLPKDLKFEWPKVQERNEIDKLVNTKLRNLRMTPSEQCDDLTFLRRAFIDLSGTLPSLERVQAFQTDTDPAKREKLVDDLLKQPGFVDLWTLKWADLLQIRTINNQSSNKTVQLYHNWLRDQILAGVPLNQLAAKLLTATGSNLENPAATFYTLELDPIRVTEDAAQAMLGIRIQCAQCHNHPFDRWTMSDYRGFMAFFMQVGRKQGEDPREKIIYNAAGGEAKHPVGDKVVPPKFPGGEEPDVKGKDRREVLAQWLADPQNPWFAKHMANLVWAQLMGIGIVNPVDDIRISNPASNPELLSHLANRMVEHNFDIRKLAREICLSATYQRSTRSNETNELDTKNFAKATIRRMRAEVLLDAISDASGNSAKHVGMSQGMRAVEIADAKKTNYFLTTFGRSTRDNVCAREEVSPTLSQALHLLTGDTVEGNMKAGNLVTKLLTSGKKPAEVMIELYLRVIGRTPTPEESASLEALFSDAEQTKATLEDIQWALLNSKEFLFNH
ncbi:MAG: Protein of unknown function (DUF1553)/Protein of unknown function (DUF1549) [Verrucomicrobia bacterium]|nr:MAG: Protein of unknown function (DUF1553)/Protein of unknown function (DUF1549) [Verrucomicrobiota bacterium]